ncbi:MAG: hypothetical protein PHT31_06775, partial [Candidatus Omnitrophica bacterium]|nr:hypothetical protein [Candidatus Omnitrophota bacterium]
NLFNMGKYNDALEEFRKVLLVEPDNAVAQQYINAIFAKESGQPVNTMGKDFSREEAMNYAFAQLDKNNQGSNQLQEEGEKEKLKVAGLEVTGESQLSLGLTGGNDFIWKRANGDLNEENYRTMSDDAFNRRNNTYDPRVYDRLRVNLDKKADEGFAFHSNITVDPWSFTGKSEAVNILGQNLDVAQVKLLYWSNTGYTVNQTVRTLEMGDSFALPEIKVKKGKTDPFNITSLNTNIFSIPEIKINREFQPLREIWLDYKQEGLKVRAFPLAYQDQALTSSDPLHLSNNHIWWEESPWIRRWLPGTFDSGLATPDFVPGEYDNSLAYLVRDSDGTRLTGLRGFSLDVSPLDSLSITNTFATPKDLWQDYTDYDNIINALQMEYRPTENLKLGSVYTYRLGVDEAQRRDSTNGVFGFNFDYEFLQGLLFSAETAISRSKNDLTFPNYETKSRGNAYYFSLLGRFPQESIINLDNGYFEIKQGKEESSFSKFRFYGGHMDNGFNSSLASYRETRDDAYWSRHLHFRKPFDFYYAGLYGPSMGWDDIEPYRIGNGIDIGRNALGFRLESSLWDRQMENLFDVRNVHNVNGKFVENIARDEMTIRLTDRLTSKLLGIYQKMPRTKGHVDPFLFDTNTGEYLINDWIEDGKDPSLKTGSLGLEYALTDWAAISGIWERTNDSTMAYDNFPRGNLTSSFFATNSFYDRIYREQKTSLYGQGLFPLPPYPYYNIWKSGLKLTPLEHLDIYLDYTRNEFKSAGQIDDNMNHVGFEANYSPTKKMAIYFRYSYSRWNDLERMLEGFDKIYLGHHNFFAEFKYMPSPDDELALQYGESGRSPIATVSYDPFGGSQATLDTQHIVRAYYRKRF